jgi:hypothetical protein
MDGSLQQIADTTTKMPLSLHKEGSDSTNSRSLSCSLILPRPLLWTVLPVQIRPQTTSHAAKHGHATEQQPSLFLPFLHQ